jgi:hypothetical protein
MAMQSFVMPIQQNKKKDKKKRAVLTMATILLVQKNC